MAKKSRTRKLSKRDRALIVNLYVGGATTAELSRKYDVSLNAIKYHLMDAGVYKPKWGTRPTKCNKCGSPKEDKWHSACLACRRPKQRAVAIKASYDIEESDYSKMVVEQSGLCAICGRGDGPLYIDHNHDSGEVRGLLCPSCNTGLGVFGDSRKTIEGALRYLGERGSYGD